MCSFHVEWHGGKRGGGGNRPGHAVVFPSDCGDDWNIAFFPEDCIVSAGAGDGVMRVVSCISLELTTIKAKDKK